MSFFTSQIITWYNENKRELPWRGTKDPYLIWLSEIILQQTRVAQGMPYYMRYVGAYPTVFAMANADEEEFMRIWQGLGYYSRARNMRETAKLIAQQGFFPTNYAELVKLKGVGEYTAAAIASFAYNEDVAVLDGNVFRVLSRFYGIEDDILSGKGKKKFAELANEILPKGHAATYNQAIMEFGALHCKPKQPLCASCPLALNCFAFKEKKQAELPVKAKKAKVKERFFHYFLIENDDKFYLRKREKGDIWQSLYDLPLFESDKMLAWQGIEILDLPMLSNLKMTHEYPSITHVLTHQKLHIRFFLLHFDALNTNDEALKAFNLYDLTQIEALPKPIVVSNFFKNMGGI
jgi:A/G-specific adenine glycosylase